MEILVYVMLVVVCVLVVLVAWLLVERDTMWKEIGHLEREIYLTVGVYKTAIEKAKEKVDKIMNRKTERRNR